MMNGPPVHEMGWGYELIKIHTVVCPPLLVYFRVGRRGADGISQLISSALVVLITPEAHTCCSNRGRCRDRGRCPTV